MGRLATKDKKPISKDRNRFLEWGLEVVQALFPILLITYLLLILLETIFGGSVSYYINLNQLLMIVIAVGVAAVLTAPSNAERAKGERLTTKGTFIIICAGLAGAAAVWYKTQEIGWLSYVISAVSGGLIVLLSMLTWRGDEEAEQKSDRRAVREAEDTFQRARREAKEAMERAIREVKEGVNEEGNSRGG